MSRRGLTMIEVAMAIVILSLGLAPMVRAFAEGARQTIAPIQGSQAAFLATERMEEIVAARFRSTSGYSLVTAANFPDESSISGLSQFGRTVSITEVASDLVTPQSGSGLKKAVVTVTWQGGAKSLAVARLFTDF